MTQEMCTRIVSDARRTLEGDPPSPNFADVYWCYRLLLQRCPEFDGEQAYTDRHLPDLRRLAGSFLDSQEFGTLWPDKRETLPDITVMAETSGLRFWFNLRDRLIGQLIALGRYEPETTALVRQIVKPGMNCLDVGANIGYFSITMAKLVGNTGSVRSFEPFSATYDLLNRNLGENSVQDVVRSFRMAAHERSGKCPIFYRSDSANDNFGSMFVSNLAQDEHLSESAVETMRLDDIVPHDLPVHFVKMDVEGAEIAALRGMGGIIARYRPTMLVELNEVALQRGNRSAPEELLQLLADFRYVVRDAGSGGVFTLPLQRDGRLFANLLCEP